SLRLFLMRRACFLSSDGLETMVNSVSWAVMVVPVFPCPISGCLVNGFPFLEADDNELEQLTPKNAAIPTNTINLISLIISCLFYLSHLPNNDHRQKNINMQINFLSLFHNILHLLCSQ